MPFRFVHTADLHLDSPLRSLALRDAGLAARIGSATREALRAIVDLCLRERVDALLIAGDLYDGAQTSMKTARFLAAELGRLDGAGIATCIIRGNHDAVSRITREMVLPPSVHVFGPEAGMRSFHDGAFAVHGISFADPVAPASLLPRFRAPVPGAVNIGMMHTSLSGAAGHDVYAPCALADLMAAGFAYWALGHIHRRAVHQSAAAVVMPGMPQGRDIGEAGPKSATLVTIADDGSVALEERPTSVAQFERVIVADAADWGGLVQSLKQALRQARRDHAAPDLILRPVIAAGGALAWRLARDADLLLAQAQDEAAAIGSVWIDKVEMAGGAWAAPPAGALGELAALLADPPPAALAEGAEALEVLLKALPPPMRDGFGADPVAQGALLRDLMAEGAAALLARLAGGEG